jgi:hypothetical protein
MRRKAVMWHRDEEARDDFMGLSILQASCWNYWNSVFIGHGWHSCARRSVCKIFIYIIGMSNHIKGFAFIGLW